MSSSFTKQLQSPYFVSVDSYTSSSPFSSSPLLKNQFLSSPLQSSTLTVPSSTFSFGSPSSGLIYPVSPKPTQAVLSYYPSNFLKAHPYPVVTCIACSPHSPNLIAYASAPSSAYPLKLVGLFHRRLFECYNKIKIDVENMLEMKAKEEKDRQIRNMSRIKHSSSVPSLVNSSSPSNSPPQKGNILQLTSTESPFTPPTTTTSQMLSYITSLLSDLDLLNHPNIHVYIHRARSGRVGIINLKGGGEGKGGKEVSGSGGGGGDDKGQGKTMTNEMKGGNVSGIIGSPGSLGFYYITAFVCVFILVPNPSVPVLPTLSNQYLVRPLLFPSRPVLVHSMCFNHNGTSLLCACLNI
jgi:hypothetical protein